MRTWIDVLFGTFFAGTAIIGYCFFNSSLIEFFVLMILAKQFFSDARTAEIIDEAMFEKVKKRG